MNWNIVLRTQGYLLLILALIMLLPAGLAFFGDGLALMPFFLGISITAGTGLLLILGCRKPQTVRAREGFVIVSLGWIFAAVFSALPLVFHGSFGNMVNCVFETMSGFTTTGATILTDIESIPRALLFWRSMTHWLGGMGIILLTIAILPVYGISFAKLFNAEVPGPTKDRLSPKIKNTAKILWLIYLGMTVLETGLLMVGGMDLFDALCHTFGTLATGGFSPRNASIAAFNSGYIEVVIIVFMYLAGTNFALHFHLIRGNLRQFFRNREWQVYTLVLVVAVLLISLNLHFSPDPALQEYGSYPEALRASSFQVLSITTTTGYVTRNFDIWPGFSKWLLVFLMFLGGCAGSTGGGMKQIRVIIVLKSAWNEIRKLFNHHAVFTLKVRGELVKNSVIKNVSAFVILFIAIFVAVVLFLAAMGYDLVTSFSASIATLGNIGPGLARVGAVENYAFFDPASKLVLTFSMLLGRLEIYSVLILLYSFFYRSR